jgi:alpha-beta hydrolase superfamily lysophospholipase
MKRLRIALAVTVGLIALCALGPRHRAGPVNAAKAADTPALAELPGWLAAREAAVSDLRPGNQARLHPASPSEKTPLSLVYLHGYSAAPEEIEPVVEQVSDRLGANSFRPRLRGHGRTPEALGPVKAGAWFEDTEEALSVGATLGDRTVVIGTSTGGTLGALAALEHPELAGLVLISPNFGPQDATADALLLPWLGLLLPQVLPEHCWDARNEAQAQHWTTCYPITSVASMMVVVDTARQADWSSLQVPVLILRSDDDDVVQQPAIDAWAATLGVPNETVLFTATGDESGHVLAGDITAPSNTARATQTVADWIEGL